MRLGGLIWCGLLGLFVGCSSSDGGEAAEKPSWRCYLSPTPEGVYCECRLATDAQLEAEHLDPEGFTENACPASNYKCCEHRTVAQDIYGIESCICWNPETQPFCDAKVDIVSRCPS